MKNNYLVLCLFFSHLYAWQPYQKPMHLALNTSADFGRKHFIIGYKKCKKEVSVKEKTTNVCEQRLFDAVGDIKAALFAPSDDLRSTLLYLIEKEQKHISIAMFAFTDKDFAHALAEAQRRGVLVEIVVDPSNMYGRYNKLDDLQNGSVQIFVYNPNRFNKKIPGAMHNKFVLFEKNIQNKSLIWTGSFNFTRAAHQRNQENVVVLDDSMVVQKFAEQFKELKKYADTYNAPAQATQKIVIR